MAIENIEDPTTRSEFAYDGLGRRIGLTDSENGIVVRDLRLVYCGTALCAKADRLTGAVTRYYPEGESQGGIGSYYHRDHLGSVRAVSDDAGSLEAAYAFDPWGRRTTLLGNPDEVEFGYTGHFTHHPTGLALAPYRAYDPDVGRWISRDPIGEAGGINLYGYVQENPISFSDPLGLAEYVGLEGIERALERLAAAQGDDFHTSPYYAPERAMLDRLRVGYEDPSDIAFYHHEKAEADECLKYSDLPDEDYLQLQQDAHDQVLKQQGNTWRDLYHPSVQQRYPEYFR